MTTIYIKQDTELPERREAEFYPTEMSLVLASIETYRPLYYSSILDIGAGDGRWGKIAKSYMPDVYLCGVDVRELPEPVEFDEWVQLDFSSDDAVKRMRSHADITYDFIVSNPPYNVAEKIIRNGWKLLSPGGTMIMLLRLAFQEGVNRYNGLWSEIPPIEVGVLSRRPSFYGRGTNGTAYGIYCWQKDEYNRCAGIPRKWYTRLINYERMR